MPQDASPIHPAKLQGGMAYLPEENAMSVNESMLATETDLESFYIFGLLRELGHHHRHGASQVGDGAAWDWAKKYIDSLPPGVRSDERIVHVVDQVSKELNFAKVEERYTFHRLCDHDLGNAKFALEHLEQVEDELAQHALMKDAVLSYARPFSRSHGYFSKRHTLPDTFVPEEHRNLHKRLMFYRDQVFAHTDINAKQPRVSRFKMERGFWYPMSFKGLSPEELMPHVAEMLSLVASVTERNQEEIARIQAEVLDRIPYRPRQADGET